MQAKKIGGQQKPEYVLWQSNMARKSCVFGANMIYNFLRLSIFLGEFSSMIDFWRENHFLNSKSIFRPAL